MIVRDEEKVLARCLESIRPFVDEIIIVDTGSTDSTKEIATRFTDKVFDFKWCDDFSKARNFSFSKATLPFIMWLDADDVILPQYVDNWKSFVDNFDISADVVMLPYDLAFDNTGNVTFWLYRERVVRRNLGLQWNGTVHEAITPCGKIVYGNARVAHQKTRTNPPRRNLKIYQNMERAKVEFSPRECYYYGRELYFNNHFNKASKVLQKFIDHRAGWTENLIDGCVVLSWCYAKLKKSKKQFFALTQSFLFDEPHRDVCFELGNLFFEQQNYNLANYWFNQTLNAKDSGGFINQDLAGFLPYLSMALCQYYLGNIVLANSYNEKAGEFKPENSAVVHNREFFKRLLKD